MATGGGRTNPGYDPDQFELRATRNEETHIHRDDEEETSFGGRPETEPLIPSGSLTSLERAEMEQSEKERERDDAWEEIIEEIPSINPKTAPFTASISEYGIVGVKLKRSNAKEYAFFGVDGGLNPDLPQTIKDYLSKLPPDVVSGNERRIEGIREEISRLRDGATTDEYRRRIKGLEDEVERLEANNEAIEERMPLRERVKAIFKKHGLTAFAVLSAVGTIIGVIVSDHKSGLTKMTKGIGDGLKDIAKKLAGILPGIVGSLVSFLFKTAGEAIGFLSKHAWLLILLVVTFVVEQFKGARRQD